MPPSRCTIPQLSEFTVSFPSRRPRLKSKMCFPAFVHIALQRMLLRGENWLNADFWTGSQVCDESSTRNCGSRHNLGIHAETATTRCVRHYLITSAFFIVGIPGSILFLWFPSAIAAHSRVTKINSLLYLICSLHKKGNLFRFILICNYPNSILLLPTSRENYVTELAQSFVLCSNKWRDLRETK